MITGKCKTNGSISYHPTPALTCDKGYQEKADLEKQYALTLLKGSVELSRGKAPIHVHEYHLEGGWVHNVFTITSQKTFHVVLSAHGSPLVIKAS